MLHLLLIDDNPQDRTLIVRELERAFAELTITEVGQPEMLEQAITAGRFDLTITDYLLRWSDGLTVLRTLKARYPERPVIMFTNSGSQEIAVEAMKSGLDDYIIKSPSHYVRLPAAIRLALERASIRRQLAGVEARLQTLTNRLEVGVYRLTSEGALIDANPAFLRLLGLSALTQVPANQSLATYFAPPDYRLLLSQLQQNGSMRDREFQIRQANGNLIWVRLSKTVTEVDGIQVIDGLIEDISARKQIELENQQLYLEARRANQLKDEFLAIVSHELRTPLNAILGWANILKTQQPSPETIRKALDVIERNARLQTKLINDILDISRITRNQLSLNRQPVDLIPVLQSAIDDIQPSANAKSIQIITEFDSTTGQVLGDPERLEQVIWNVLSNAVKFTTDNGKITIKLERVGAGARSQNTPPSPSFGEAHEPPSPRSSYAQITISDTGKGISPEFLPHVFDRFRQADGSRTRAHGGLGLGLAIAQHLVEMHDGIIQVSSEGLDKGATFTICLPLIDPVPVPAIGSGVTLNDDQLLKGLTILTVDDEEDTVELTQFMLQSYGAEVTVAYSAKDALEQLRNSSVDVPIDLLISDIGMPNADGYWLIRQVRALPGPIGQIPAIALTAYVREEEQAQIAAADFQAHVSKPVDPTELLEAIRKVAQR
ncbi:response regulator [Leptolyngbya sp. NK1-12]|uniref:histidine kinase n=1 Tax=Leptolyngbya sp. NK1-12 TaxID=2547451 RepID=A0AA96WZF8_9CYAN|nr:response regulator [Leptolyngbya sp. NK1-12]